MEERGKNIEIRSTQYQDKYLSQRQEKTISRHQTKLNNERQEIDKLNESLEQATIDDLTWHVKYGNESLEKNFQENKQKVKIENFNILV